MCLRDLQMSLLIGIYLRCITNFAYKAAVQQKKEIDAQKSKSILASLLHEASVETVNAAIDSGKPYLRQTLQTMALTAGAQSLATNFVGTDHGSLVQMLRAALGNPTTKVHLPIPIMINGKSTSVIDTRVLSYRKANHCKNNNRLIGADQASSALLKKDCSLLHSYDDAYKSGIQFFGITNESLSEEDAINAATQASLSTLTEDDLCLHML
jgi:hypothetical protein